jgi:hypothetical protein
VRVSDASAPTWPLVSALLFGLAGCTRPNPAYVELDAATDPDAGGWEMDAPDLPDAPDEVMPPPDAGDEAPAPDAAADAPPAAIPGLVAHWPLDEGQGTAAADATGNLNDGTLLNGPTWIASDGTALHFDGTDDYVDLAVRTLPRAEAPKTIAVWFRNTALAPRLRNLVALFNDQMNSGIHLGFDENQVAVWRFGDFDPVIKSSVAPDGGWHHLAYSWDGGTHRLYLDGAPLGTSTAGVKNGAVQTARLGTWQPPEEMFSGDLDDVRVYGRALADGEIARLAASAR